MTGSATAGSARAGSARREWLLVLVVGAAAVVHFQSLFGAFFPSANGRIGHDYGYFFPQLLTGYFWYEQNGLWAVPWFTPAIGGGLPYYANPVSSYYSVPQLLVLFMDPLAAVRVLLGLFAGLGFLGTYLMTRRALGCGVWAALLAAVLFTFNGFYSARMLVGHMAFHSIMLLPWIVWLVVRPLPERGRVRRALFDALAAGALFAYMFQSGYFYGIPVVAVAAGCIALIAALRRPGELGGWSWVPRLGAAGLVSLLLSSSKFSASTAFLASFPRSEYSLPGFDGVWTGVTTLARSVFWYAPADFAEAITNTQYNQSRHEFEYGVTPLPALLALLGGAAWLIRRRRAGAVAPRRSSAPVVALELALLAALLVLPFAINVYTPDWNAFLKTVPFLKSSSNLLRNLAIYIPVAIALGALGVEGLPAKLRPAAAVVAALLALVFIGRDDRSAYAQEIYDPSAIVSAWRAVDGGEPVPPITEMVAPFDANGRPHVPIDRNDALVRGGSQLICYEPIFGYQLEFLFPLYALALGPVTLRGAGGYNVRNPALFVFPEENGGKPGEPFRPDEFEQLERFVSYRPFEFRRSDRQRAMDLVNQVALVLAGLLLASYPLWRPARRSSTADDLSR